MPQPFFKIIASAVIVSEIIETTTVIFALLAIGTVAIGKRMAIAKACHLTAENMMTKRGKYESYLLCSHQHGWIHCQKRR